MTTQTPLAARSPWPTDLTVTRMGYGAMQLAGPGVFGPPADRDAAVAVLREAVELGITHIDTSDFYGPTSPTRSSGRRCTPTPSPAHRHQGRRAPRRRGRLAPRPLPEQLRQAVHDNLEHLGLDALDVVNLRVGGVRRPRAGLDRRAVHRAGRAPAGGTDPHLGISTVSAEQIAEAQSIAPVVCVQNFYNVAHREDDDLIDSLAAQGIAYVPYFPLGGFTPLQSGDAGRGGRPSRRHADGRRAGLAAAALAEHPADPGHLVGRPSARERRRGCARPFPRRTLAELDGIAIGPGSARRQVLLTSGMS